jgi:methionine synthase II (cobalamin-independent)
MDGIASEVVDYLLFVDEAKLTDNVHGTSGFAERFSASGPKDRKGRSLYELDLTHRLMKYPCSYLIYSPAFDALPPMVKEPIYKRMWAILSGQEQDQRYRAVLSNADRQAIVEILRDTKKDLPRIFRTAAHKFVGLAAWRASVFDILPFVHLLPTTLVGSYPQPEWLIDRAKLAGRFPPRVRAKELWRIPEQFLEEAQNDATLLAIRAQEDAGLDIITDGEIRRESYSNRFATALDGVDLDNPAARSIAPAIPTRAAHRRQNQTPPRGRSRRPEVPEGAHDAQDEDHRAGPFTMSQQAQNDFYKSDEEAALDYAEAVNQEIKDLFAAGADVVQIDEPYMQARPEKARQYGLKALNRALEGVSGTTVRAHLLRLCRHHPRTSIGIFVPARAGRLPLQADFDRDRAVAPRLLGAASIARQTDPAGDD